MQIRINIFVKFTVSIAMIAVNTDSFIISAYLRAFQLTRTQTNSYPRQLVPKSDVDDDCSAQTK